MIKRIKALAEGRFEYEPPELLLSETRIEKMVFKDGLLQGSFWIESKDDRKIEGVIYTTDSRMRCLKVQFSGKKTEIPYEFQALGMDENDTNKGEIYVESNAGELVIPYVVTVEKQYANTSLGKIKNLFHFANLARQDFQKAYQLFCSKSFTNILMSEEQKLLYESLVRQSHVSMENMEEFLIAVHKKEAVTFEPDTKEVELVSEGQSFKKNITLTKSGWGHIAIHVWTDAYFIHIEKSELTAEDFAGNRYLFEFIVDVNMLHAGKNTGNIIFSNLFQNEILQVEVSVPNENKNENHLAIKKLEEELCYLYFDVRCKTIHNSNWIKNSLNCVEKILALGVDDDLYLLLRAQLLIMGKKKEDARWIFNAFQDKRMLKRQRPEVYAYLQYIMALYKQDGMFTKQIAKEITELSEQFKESFRLVWIRLFIEDGLEDNILKKFQLLKEQFDFGCRSPFLYIETYLLMQKDINLIGRLDVFTLQVLNFAVSQAIIEETIIDKAANLSLRIKKFEPLVFRLLTSGYYLFHNDSCVEALCSMLIKGNKKSAQYFEWFERGVLRGLKLTMLYEYYLYTIPEENKALLPKALLLYFSYGSTLDYRKKAFLFANVWKHQEEIPELFISYKPHIELFVIEHIMGRHINEDLAYLYEQMSELIFENEEAMNNMEELMFTYRLVCENRRICRIVVKYEQLDREYVFPVTDNKAWIKYYTGRGKILLEDVDGKRHIQTIPYEKHSLIREENIAKYSLEFKKENLGILLNRYEKCGTVLQERNLEIYEKLLKRKEIKKQFEQVLLKKLIYYYKEKEETQRLDKALVLLDFLNMPQKERAGYVEMMISRGLYKEAYQVILQYGPEEIRIKRLVRLCSRLVQEELLVGSSFLFWKENASNISLEESLLQTCYYVFKNGKYDEVVLEHLTKYFYGTTWQMQRLWSAAKRFDVETYDICEKILVQMLFTGYLIGESDEIFADYYRSGAKKEVVSAYLTFFAYQYVVHEQLVGEELFSWILKEYDRGEEVGDACQLALLKHYSKNKELPDRMISILQKMLECFLDRNIYFSFFCDLDIKVIEPYRIMGRTIIEYRSNPQNHVFVHYRLVNDASKAGAYFTEPMQPAIGGIFVKDLIVFYGEKIQYYITEKQETSQMMQTTYSGTIENQYDIGNETDGRYDILNEIAISYYLKDDKTLQDLLERYVKTEAIAESLFECK